jgi:hypothetical protein
MEVEIGLCNQFLLLVKRKKIFCSTCYPLSRPLRKQANEIKANLQCVTYIPFAASRRGPLLHTLALTLRSVMFVHGSTRKKSIFSSCYPLPRALRMHPKKIKGNTQP